MNQETWTVQQENRQTLSGPFAVFAKTCLLDDARPVVPLSTLLRDETLDRCLSQVYGPQLMRDKLTVLVSQWFKYYAMQLIPPVIVARLVMGVSWPLALDRLSFAMDERGVLDGVRFEGEGFNVPSVGNVFEDCAPLLENLRSVIERLSEYGGIARRVLWSSAGDYLETCLRQLAPLDEAAAEIGYGLLHEQWRPDGTRNPLFKTVFYKKGLDGQPVRQRRSRCMSYQVEWVGRCEHCPLEKHSPL